MDMDQQRCQWVGSHPLEIVYHDTEWGVPVHDDQRLFELLILEGAQAGLNWLTVLKKRESYREAFAGFDPAEVARFDEARVATLLRNPGIVRNRLKVAATIGNAQAFLQIQREHGSFDQWIWRFTSHETLRSAPGITLETMPSSTPESDAMSRELRKRGFRFVGATICYAFMQSVGMVNDHVDRCWRAQEIPESA